MAALLAEAGIAGPDKILEGPKGLLAAWHATPQPGAELIPGPSDDLQITQTTIKNWPTCGQMHSALDAAANLVHQQGWAVNDVVSVRVDLPRAALDIADIKHPATLTEAKFSTSFCVALVLSGGDLSFVGFNDAVLQNLLACDLQKRVQVVHEPAFTKRFPLERPARVTIYTRDGREHVNERSFRRGDPESPWSWEELQARFISIASLAQLSDSSSAEVVSWCSDLASRGATSPIDPVLPFASSLPSI